MSDVTVIGLGPMGLALADLALKAGKRVSLWNRSPAKAEPLVQRGAAFAATPAAAISASPVTLVCVYDYDAVEAIATGAGFAAASRGRLIVNLGTGSPDDARRIDALIRGYGGRYLDGAIQAAPSQMGQDNTPILVSGPHSAFAEAQPSLKILAGNIVHLGEDIGAAAAMDLSTLSYVYGAFAGFLHGARIAESVGIDVAIYGKLVNAISPSFGAFFEHEGRVIASGDFRITESPLRISTPAVRRILLTSERLGLNTALPTLVDDWLTKAEAAGFANEEVAATIKILRSGTAASAPEEMRPHL
ncbi:MAG: NAD(P)-dependent oxidoreductase [Alphaproteobacteria bacterium]|nr:NAD(P)-dependent oxidoreductase [Alphaproteobacteria bacterium]